MSNRMATRERLESQSVQPDPLERLRARHPDAVLWFGTHTWSYWALVRRQDGTDELLEAKSPAELDMILSAFYPNAPKSWLWHETPHSATWDDDAPREVVRPLRRLPRTLLGAVLPPWLRSPVVAA